MAVKRWMNWVPAVAVPVVVVTGAVLVPLQAGAAVGLPGKTPQQLLEFAASSSVNALSGTVEQTSDLGLPDLSGLTTPGKPGSDNLATGLDLLTGTHTARVYLDGQDARVQLMDRLAERDVIRSGESVWFYDSAKQTALHVALPTGTDATAPDAGTVPTPQQVADRVLGAIGSTAKVTVGHDGSVAGRPAYDLVVTPTDPDTLIGSVSLSIDAQTGLALAAAVQAKGADHPAFRVAFSALSLDNPDASLFQFTPPAGTKVTEKTAERPSGSSAHGPMQAPMSGLKTIGTGWSSVVELPAADLPAGLLSSPTLSGATTAVPGGRLVSTALLNLLITDDGRVLAGAVTPERLQAAAAGA